MPGTQTKNLASSPECLQDPVFYPISDSPEDSELLFFRPHSCGRILKTFVNYFSCFGGFGRDPQIRAADRAGHFSPIADRDRQVKYGALKFLGSFGALTGDIDADFLHDYKSVRINSCSLNASA